METSLEYAKCNYKDCKCGMVFLLNECNDCYDLYCTLSKNSLCKNCQKDADQIKHQKYLMRYVFNQKIKNARCD